MQYIISGIAPGFGGVAKFIEFLQNNLDHSKYIFLYPNKDNKNFQNILSEIVNKDIILIHPQSIGLEKTINLIKHNNCKLYIVDNSFFCIKSYNHLDNTLNECLECLTNNNGSLKNNCSSFPRTYSPTKNIKFINELKSLIDKITFLTLSNSSNDLLRSYYGNNITIEKTSFLTEDILIEPKEKSFSENPSYDIVYHASDIEAKGFSYIQELATRLPSYSFFIPTNKVINKKLKNITWKYITWENGLQSIVEHAKIVITPSLWSYMPETATFKSFLFNGSVALIDNKFGFSNDLPNDIYIHLTGNLVSDTLTLKNTIENKDYLLLRNKSLTYMQNYTKMAYQELSKEFKFNNSLNTIIQNISLGTSHTHSERKVNLTKNIYNLIKNLDVLLKDDSKTYILYGKGTIGNLIYQLYPEKNISFIERESSFTSKKIFKGESYSPENLVNMNFNSIIITVLGREKEIIDYLTSKFNIPYTKIKTLDII